MVIDASVVAAWYIPGQATPTALAWLDAKPRPRWRAPHCFTYETPNLLLRQETRRALPTGATERILANLNRSAPIRCERAPDRLQSRLALELARDQRLSLFGGFYLLLALQLSAPLVTRDGPLAQAASREGCKVFDVSVAT